MAAAPRAFRARGFERRRFSGASRTRTGDLLGAIQALSQLSYSPVQAIIGVALWATRRLAAAFATLRGVMGALDEAIRQHLELKRKLGASEDELKAKEDEAFGRGKPLPPPSAEALEPAPEAFEPVPGAIDVADAEPEPEPEREVYIDDLADDTVEHPSESAVAEPEPESPEAEVKVVETPLEPAEFAPDEVLPEEALEPEPESGSARPSEDVLEDTPEFLEQSPDQDRLWFEQKPPKDFDFDD
jgi:hypothetical protein